MTKTKKKKYEKPQVRKVDLDGKTSVLGFCKTSGYSGPLITNSCTLVGSCSQPGS